MNLLQRLLSVSALALGVAACNIAPLNVKFVEPKIATFKGHGNRVAVGEGSLVGDVLAIEIMKNGKFVLASRDLQGDTTPAEPAPAEPAPAPAAAEPEAAPAEGAPAVAEAAPAAEPAPAPAPSGEQAPIDYTFRVATITSVYDAGNNSYPATYSFSVTAKTGEIIYIKALSGGDLKVELAETVAELAGLLL